MTTLPLLAVLASGGCLNNFDHYGDPPGSSSDPLCTSVPPTASPPLRRLSKAQYGQVLADVLKVWAPSVADAVMASGGVTSALGKLRPDNRVNLGPSLHGGFRRLDQDVGQDQVDNSFAIAKAVGVELTGSSDRLTALLGTCATDADATNDDACVRSFIEKAGRAAHRRKLDVDDIDFYVSVYAAAGIDKDGIADVIGVMLTNPYFFYQVEHGDAVADPEKHRYVLSGEELANRLALQFWNGLPDGQLLSAADSGAILTAEGLASAIEHVFASPRIGTFYGEFFREFLSAEDLPEIDLYVGTSQFDALRGSFTPGPDTRENMIEEVTRLATYYATKADGKFDDLYTTRKSFATTADVASLYGVAPWSGTGEPPDIPAPAYVGLLTHAGIVATGTPLTRPIMKGVVVRSTFLCDTLLPPSANAMQVAQEQTAKLDPIMTSRQRTTAITADGACASCHAEQINPLGFITENFDALGRVRTMESIFDATGTLLAQLPVDTTAAPHVKNDDATTVSTAADLAKLMLESNKAQSCMASKYYRFSFAQLENPENDSCVLGAMTDGFTKGKPLGTVLSDLAKSASFKQRVFD